jgi:hypothetical protein
MKYLKLTLISILCVGMATAQFSKGSKSAGGGFSYAMMTDDGEDAGSMMTVNPDVRYYVADGIAVSVGFTMTSFTPPEGDGWKNTGFGLGAYYHINDNIYAGGSYSSMTPEVDGNKGEASTSLNLRGGYLHGLSESVFLDVNGNYTMGMGDNKAGGMTFGVGIISYF